MKKKGFTLVELLAVIVILSVIALLTTITVSSILKDSKKTLSDRQKYNIEQAAETYYLKEGMNINAECVNVSELLQKGYIEGTEVINPEDSESMTGSVIISYASNQYSYTYQENYCN